MRFEYFSETEEKKVSAVVIVCPETEPRQTEKTTLKKQARRIDVFITPVKQKECVPSIDFRIGRIPGRIVRLSLGRKPGLGGNDFCEFLSFDNFLFQEPVGNIQKKIFSRFQHRLDNFETFVDYARNFFINILLRRFCIIANQFRIGSSIAGTVLAERYVSEPRTHTIIGNHSAHNIGCPGKIVCGAGRNNAKLNKLGSAAS